MLVEINCSLFRTKKITFKPGLNVVIGDDNASNSIGKSTLLMIIDFVFGGNTFLSTNRDVIDELGHHEYSFSLSFNGNFYYFKRKTELGNIVFLCDHQYNQLEELSITQYHIKLSELYKLPSDSITFRAMVSLYSRIWPKENLMDVKKPLHTLPSQGTTECIDNLIKTFNLFHEIRNLSQRLKDIGSEKSALNAAFNKKIISKINKTQFKSNNSLINKAEAEILDIKQNLAVLALDFKSLVNKDVLDAKLQKDKLLDIKFNLESKLARVQNNLKRNKFVTNKTFSELTNYFSNINLEKLEKVENFHSSLTSILNKELKASELNLTLQLEEVNVELLRLEKIISLSLQSIENPNYIVDRVFEISNSLSKAKTENSYYESKNNLQTQAKNAAVDLNQKKITILDQIMERINKRLELLTIAVYGSKGKSPSLILADNSYEFTIFEDTGTGKAFSNLILFDLAVLSETILPFLIHDSVLFKNVENNAVANLINIYASFTKQSFVAIDEIDKYGKAKNTLVKNKVIHLTSNNVLYIRNWKVAR